MLTRYHLCCQVLDFKDTFVVDNEGHDVDLFVLLLKVGDVGLQQPVDGNSRVVLGHIELAASKPFFVLEENDELLGVQQLPEDCLRYVAPLKGLISTSTRHDVTESDKHLIPESLLWVVLKVTNCIGDLDLVDVKDI